MVSRRAPETDQCALERGSFLADCERNGILTIVNVRQVGSLRTGSISLRGLQLTRPLLEILRSDEVEIELSLDDNPSAEPGVFSKRGNADRLLYSTRANDFMDVCARVVNNSGQSSSSVAIPIDR